MSPEELWEEYCEHVAMLRDSTEHKRLLLRNPRCFEEWCDERAEAK
jgi:hypothetical protein